MPGSPSEQGSPTLASSQPRPLQPLPEVSSLGQLAEVTDAAQSLTLAAHGVSPGPTESAVQLPETRARGL